MKTDIFNTEKEYNIIYADPPWKQSKGGKKKVKENSSGKVTKHSKKPNIAYEIIERLYPNTEKLEIFARNYRDGWDCWGNEV